MIKILKSFASRSFFELYNWLSVIISIILCILCDFLMKLFYEWKWKLPNFENTLTTLKNEYVSNNRFEISEDRAFQNYFIERHYNYLDFLDYRVCKRIRIRKMLVALATIIYVLFFWQIPN